jgi:uncharacterized membrane protein
MNNKNYVQLKLFIPIEIMYIISVLNITLFKQLKFYGVHY